MRTLQIGDKQAEEREQPTTPIRGSGFLDIGLRYDTSRLACLVVTAASNLDLRLSSLSSTAKVAKRSAASRKSKLTSACAAAPEPADGLEDGEEKGRS